MTTVQVDIAEFDRATRLAYVVSELQRIRVSARSRGEHYSAGQLKGLIGELSCDVRAAADDAMLTDSATFEKDD